MKNSHQPEIHLDSTAELLNDFYHYLEEVQMQYQHAIPHLKEELDFIMNGDLPSLNESLKSQQVLLLQMRGFSRQVTDYQDKLGLNGSTLSQVVTELPDQQRPHFRSLLERIKGTLQEVEFYQEKCSVLLQHKLYQIDKSLSNGALPKEITCYSQSAEEVRHSRLFKTFDKEI